MITTTRETDGILSIQGLCALLGVSRSWYYERLSQPEATPIKDLALRDAIEEIVLAFPGYGYRRVIHALARDGCTVNHKRVLRVMREESLLCQLKRRFLATTDPQHGLRRYPNRIKDLAVDRLDQVWVAARTVAWLGRNRRLSKDDERWEENSAAMVYLASIHLLLRRLAPNSNERIPYATAA